MNIVPSLILVRGIVSRFFALCLFSGIVYCAAHTPLTAQTLAFDEKSIVTFDKLQKTVLTFTAKTKPTFSVLPKSAESLVSMRFTKNDNILLVEKPLPAGTYTFTLKSGKASAQTTLTVLPSALDTTSPSHQGIMPLFYGKRLALHTKLPAGAAALPLKDFSIDYQLGNEPKNQNNPYTESFLGPNIPAAARIIIASVVWTYPLTGERVIIWTQRSSPSQIPPELLVQDVKTETAFDSTATSLTLTVRGIRLNTDVPIDADNRDPAASRSIKATLGDAEVQNNAAIDFASPETRLEALGSGAWKASPETLKLTESTYNDKSGEFLFRLTVSGLPKGTKSVLGAVKIGGIIGKIVNRKAGAVGSKELSVVVPMEWRR